MRLALGLDCGGSTSRALVLSEDGKTVFEGRGGPANLASTPLDQLTKSLGDCLSGCPSVDAVAGCFAGLLTSEDRVRAEEILRSVVPASCHSAYADYEAALAAGGDEIDGVVIAGTGAVICSRTESGTYKTGGGGPLLGDSGSLFDIGRRAVWRTLLSAEAFPLGTALSEHLRANFGTEEGAEVTARIYRHPAPAQCIAQIGAVSVRDAEHGAEYAVLSVKEALQSLAEECRHHFRDYSQVRLGLFGGLWKIRPSLAEDFQEILSQPNAAPYYVSIIEREPMEGAARLAQKLLI